jgi:hypothetical protein
LNLMQDEPLSNFASDFNLRRYGPVVDEGVAGLVWAAMCAKGAVGPQGAHVVVFSLHLKQTLVA